MSAFGTFAICLTTAYALYYTVTILLDLNKKGKEKTNDSVETFELKNVPEAPGKVVEETEGGFRVVKGIPLQFLFSCEISAFEFQNFEKSANLVIDYLDCILITPTYPNQ